MTIDIEELRRLAQAATPGPWKVDQYLGSPRQFVIHMDVGDKGRGSDVAFTSANFGNDKTIANARLIAAATPTTILELLDRLEAAENAVTEAYQRGYATGQEEIEKDLEIERMRLAACGVAALGYFEGCAKEYQSASLADVIALRKRFEASESDVSAWKGLATQFSQEADALRAKIEAMERQEPVRWFYVTNGEWDCYSRERPPEDAYDAGSLMALYALPGAQPAPGVPEFCPCCGNIMRACMCCSNEDCNAVTVTAEQAKYNKQHAVARKASGAAAPEPEAKP